MIRDYDIVVIGSGIAGLSAAVAAASAGARVAVLERATEEEYGGNTRWTEAYFRMKNESEVSDDFEERLVANAGYHLDPHIVAEMGGDYESWPPYVKAHGMPDTELVGTLAALAGPTVAWLKSFGVRFDALPTYFVTAAAPRLMPVGGGLALIEALRAAAGPLGVAFFYRTTARRLASAAEYGCRTDGQDGRREPVAADADADADAAGLAVLATDDRGRSLTLAARAVVIASGGFQGNTEMLTRYLGGCARYVRPVARGGYYNRGEGIQMALAAGAAPAGDFGSYHAEPLDPRSAEPEPLVMTFPYGVLVNRRGQRFTDEAPGPVDVHYDPISRAIGEQPEGIAYAIFDQRIDDVPNWRKGLRTDQPPIRADSLQGLAQACGLPAGALERTLQAYNDACPKDGPFLPLEADGLCTQGLDIPKSNWARPISQGPFFAYPVIPGICFTYGGIKINRHAQVVDHDGRPIPGLYAAGEASGLYHQVYTGATSVMRGAVFGKLAGEHAAALAAGRP